MKLGYLWISDHHMLMSRKTKKVCYHSSGNKNQVIEVVCINDAAWKCSAPYVIIYLFVAKNLNIDWTEGEILGTTFGLSSNG